MEVIKPSPDCSGILLLLKRFLFCQDDKRSGNAIKDIAESRTRAPKSEQAKQIARKKTLHFCNFATLPLHKKRIN